HLPEPLGEALDDDRRIGHRAGHPTHDVNLAILTPLALVRIPTRASRRSSLGAGRRDPPTPRGDRGWAPNSSKRRNPSWVGAGRPGSTSVAGRDSAAPDRRHETVLACFDAPDRDRVDPEAAGQSVRR